jgi:hypothetical protein
MRFVLCFLSCILISMTTYSADQSFGLGAVLGDPTGLAFKFNSNADNAIDAALGWTTSRLHIHANYLWQNDHYINLNRRNNIDVYYGVGLRAITTKSDSESNKTSFGPRVPLGLNFKLPRTQVQFFGEVALNLNLTPNSDIDFDAGIGARFHF